MNIYETLKQTGLPVAYARFKEGKEPPYIIYMGAGQYTFDADNTHYYRENEYRVEYYFKIKDTDAEWAIEDALLAEGFLYEKSEDIYIDSEDIFAIYYYV